MTSWDWLVVAAYVVVFGVLLVGSQQPHGRGRA